MNQALISCVGKKNGKINTVSSFSAMKLCFVISVLNNKTIIPLNFGEYPLFLANSTYGLVEIRVLTFRPLSERVKSHLNLRHKRKRYRNSTKKNGDVLAHVESFCHLEFDWVNAFHVGEKNDGAYFCYCAYVLRISRYSGFLWVVPCNIGIFLLGLKLCGESRT